MTRKSNYWRLAKGVDRFSTARGREYYRKQALKHCLDGHKYQTPDKADRDTLIGVGIFLLMAIILACFA